MNALATSAESIAMNWNAAPSTKIELKTSVPVISDRPRTMPLATVQSMSVRDTPMARISPACNGRPIRRSAKSSVTAWMKAGAGRISQTSRSPDRIRCPTRSIDPVIRFAVPSVIDAVP